MRYLKSLSALAVVGLLAACTPSTAPTTTPETESAQPQEEVAQQEPQEEKSDSAPIGTPVAVRDDRTITVKESEIVDSIRMDDQFVSPIEGKGGKLAIVYMTLANTGQESGNMFFTDFTVIDSQGRTYEELQDFDELGSLYFWLEKNNLSSPEDQIFPGGEMDTAKVFRIAPDAEDLKLFVNRNLMDIQ